MKELRALLVFTLLVLFGSALAQTPPASAPTLNCLPASPTFGKSEQAGTEMVEGRVESLRGDWKYNWCRTGEIRDGKTVYQLQKAAVLDEYKRLNASQIWDLSVSIWKSQDPLATARAAYESNKVIPAPGTMEDYRWKSLHHAACLHALANPPTNLTPYPSFTCGAAPQPPAGPQYGPEVVTPSGTAADRPAFEYDPVTKKRALVSTARAKVRQGCACAELKVPELFGVNMCKVPDSALTVSQPTKTFVTACSLVPK